MSDKSGVSLPDPQHTPEFKLEVVLEYLRTPRQKRRILKEKGITEEQLEGWHREFLSKATQIFGDTRTPPARPRRRKARQPLDSVCNPAR